MSYESKGFWIPKNYEHTSEEDSVYHHSTREDAKRPHSWFWDSSRSEMFPNKKQALQDQVGLGTEMPRPLLFGDRDITEDTSIELSISNGVEVAAGSCFGGDEIRKLPVSWVKEAIMSTHVALDG